MSVDTLTVEKRETTGKRRNKRMRAEGKIPAVLYGHGEATIPLTLRADQLETALRRRAKLFQLEGGASDAALVKEVQWDAFGSAILHVDLTRVDLKEAVAVTVAVALRGVAPGTKQGGAVDHHLRRVEIECPANAIPENLQVSINELELDQSITAGQIALPEGAKLLIDPETTVCSCTVHAVLEEEEAAPADGAEPEVIGAKADDEGEADS